MRIEVHHAVAELRVAPAPDLLAEIGEFRGEKMPAKDAIDFLLDKLRNTKNNAEFFESMNT